MCIVLQRGVDREFFLLFSVMDENMSWYLEDNIDRFGSNETNPDNEEFEESNMMHGNQCVKQREQSLNVIWLILNLTYH